VFDVVKASGREQPFVLLQPRPELQDLLPGRMDHLPNIDSAYIGLVQETGSLFAMSPDRFPLVVFSDTDSDSADSDGETAHPGLIDASSELEGDLPYDPDDRTRTFRALCRNGSPNRTCLTGMRRLAEDSRSRLSRLVDGTPFVELSDDDHSFFDDEIGQPDPHDDSGGWNNLSIVPPWAWKGSQNLPSGRDAPLGLDGLTNVFSVGSLISALLLSLVFVALRKRRSQQSRQVVSTQSVVDVKSEEPGVAVSLQPSLDLSPGEPESPPLLPSNGTASLAPLDAVAAAPATHDVRASSNRITSENNHVDREDLNDWEDSEKEGEGPVVSGKRKGRRGKRGRKKKVTVLAVEDDEKEKEKEKDKLLNGNGNVDSPEVVETTPEKAPEDLTPTYLSTLVVPLPPEPASNESSLIVSETILGELFRLEFTSTFHNLV
jgi:serine/threonine-protein kinase/endoribonuclease IRE1